jgi:hypothetical protein
MNRPRWSPWMVGSTRYTPAISSDSRTSGMVLLDRSGHSMSIWQ